MADNALKNPYIVAFINQLKPTDYPKIKYHIEREGQRVVPDVITLALVLENLTKLWLNDWKLFYACHNFLKKENNFKKITSNYDKESFDFAKILSVQEAVDRRLEMIKSGNVDPIYPDNSLIVNILEAVGEDNRIGNHDNALAGTTLAKYPCGSEKFDPQTGAGPTMLSSNGQSVTCRPPLPLDWANLYSAWMVAFMTKYEEFPYYLPKLLIPSVSGYQYKPEDYLANRAIALYAYITSQQAQQKHRLGRQAIHKRLGESQPRIQGGLHSQAGTC